MAVIKSYRMRPVIKQAIQFTEENWEEIQNWLLDELPHNHNVGWVDEFPMAITIHTHMGDMDAVHGDWIVKGLEGEFYPVQDSKFQATYEEIE